MAYASWYHWNCGRTQRKAATINHFACPSYSLYVQLLWYPMCYPGGMKARVSPVQWSKPHSILAPTQDPNPGGRIQSHKRWPLHYHCTLYMVCSLSVSGLRPVCVLCQVANVWDALALCSLCVHVAFTHREVGAHSVSTVSTAVTLRSSCVNAACTYLSVFF